MLETILYSFFGKFLMFAVIEYEQTVFIKQLIKKCTVSINWRLKDSRQPIELQRLSQKRFSTIG
ncbi:MAG TPA: hypothetical protein DEF07_08165 [Nitrosomonas sp.]|nr:hypothetical protein [Nitrosomonas sp.]